jgi:hypothetical protein
MSREKYKKNVNSFDNKQLSPAEINRLAFLTAKFTEAKRELDEFGKFLLDQHNCGDGNYTVLNGRLVEQKDPPKV